jgi:mannose-1-phosphate guanylyltransferase
MSKNFCVILAGGAGRRLWPASCEKMPKQFLDLTGTGETMLQATYRRFAEFIDADNIYVSTNTKYIDIVERQLPLLPRRHILAEPVRLGTAPAVAWASTHIAYKEPDARIVFSPADQYISREEEFRRSVMHALDFAAGHEAVVVLGVRPTMPATEYGYVQMAEQPDEKGLAPVKSFTEKPDISFAKMFMESGEFLWNTGLYVWNVRTVHAYMEKLIPNIVPHLKEFVNLSREEEQAFVEKYYPSNQYLSIEQVILENISNVCVENCSFEWADLGTWESLHRVVEEDGEGNVTIATPSIMHGCRNNIVRLSGGRVAVLEGLEDFVVAESGNVLVVCRRDDSNRVKLLANEAEMKFGEECN